MRSTSTDPVLPTPVLLEVADGVFAPVQPDGTWWEIDVPGALADMVAHNGGRRLTCIA